MAITRPFVRIAARRAQPFPIYQYRDMYRQRHARIYRQADQQRLMAIRQARRQWKPAPTLERLPEWISA